MQAWQWDIFGKKEILERKEGIKVHNKNMTSRAQWVKTDRHRTPKSC